MQKKLPEKNSHFHKGYIVDGGCRDVDFILKF